MADYAFLKLLKDKKVADSYQFYDSCCYKLHLADISYDALKKIISEYNETETEAIKKVYDDAFKTGKGSFYARENTVDFMGVEIDFVVALDKLTMEIMGLLHNFFDTFAQWINSSLFGEKALPIKKVSLANVVREIANYPEYTGTFITDFVNLTSAGGKYEFISDFNNILKHRYQIYVQSKFDLFAIQGEVSIPDFCKDGRLHVKKEVLATILSDLNFCKNLLDSSKQYVENYYTNAICNYVAHRIYNPKTYMLFENEEDYKLFRSPKNHYHYIEVDYSNILPEYHIMLSCDRMEGTEDQSIELYNSVYQIIMIREAGTTNIIGILKPDDEETFDFNDHHSLTYRKYIPKLAQYELEMFDTICESNFHYYPFLSDMTAVVLKENESDECDGAEKTDSDKTT